MIKVHLRTAGCRGRYTNWSACGTYVQKVTYVVNNVTCKSCKRTKRYRKMKMLEEV